MSPRNTIGCGVLAAPFALLALVSGCFWPAETVYHVVAGWALHLRRVVPNIQVDPAGVATGVGAFAAFVIGLHWAARSLAQRWRWRTTAAATGLTVLAFVAGIAIVGVTHQLVWLARSPERLVGGGMRPHAERVMSSNNLKQIGLGQYTFAEANGNFMAPGYTTSATGLPLHGWAVSLLPYIEHDDIYRRIDRSRPWNDPANREVARTQIREYLNPAIPLQQDADGAGLIHYAANSLAHPPGRGLHIKKGFPDGQSNTILFGEVTTSFRQWMHPLNQRDPGRGLADRPECFNGPRAGGVLFAMADGSVRLVAAHVSIKTLRAAANPNDGETLGADW